MREITRHESVERIDCAEIDKMVPEARHAGIRIFFCTGFDARGGQVSRKFFPDVAVGFSVRRQYPQSHRHCTLSRAPVVQDPRVTLNICDGVRFVAVWFHARVPDHAC